MASLRSPTVRDKRFAFITEVAAVLAGSLLMAVSAQFSVNIPFSPVPFTGQTVGVALVVALLGTRPAVLAMAAYLTEGAAGAPVFAAHHGGAIWLLAPSAGYLWSFPLAAFVIGRLFDVGLFGTLAGRFIAVLAGSAVILVCGAAWLVPLLGGMGPAFAAGVAPFIIVDLLKTGLAAVVAPVFARAGGRLGIR
ncbi:MAG: biotin transporter BioY [Candidatus Eremiobacteraeota bacterium]|nr:biotin transporter BioY [Candidatus Eremiobacteraeota bacterium]